MEIKKIILFTYGDSASASTWSNVPFLMRSTFEKKGIEIVPVDISASKTLSRLHNLFVLRPLNLLGSRDYYFTRTALFRTITDRKIRKAVDKHHDADYCIFLNFEFYNRFSAIPSLLFSDWTYRILLDDRRQGKSNILDRAFMRRQAKAISKATVVLPLFSRSADTMRRHYPDAEICSIPANVINTLDPQPLDADSIISGKTTSRDILFVGNYAYIDGLRLLIGALDRLKTQGATLHVIGMTREQVPDAPANVRFHGYLRKDVPSESHTYYSLMRSARILANPSENWGAYSSTIEAMYYYTPVTVSPYGQFVKEFGTGIRFGEYCTEQSPDTLAAIIDRTFDLSAPEYADRCLHAHKSVENYTWDTYVDSMLAIMSAHPAKHKN